MKSEKVNPWMIAKLKESHQAGGRSAQEQRAAGVAVECGLLEADHRASSGAGEGSHCRTCAYIGNHICLKITSGGSRRSIVTAARRGNTVWLVERDLRRQMGGDCLEGLQEQSWMKITN